MNKHLLKILIVVLIIIMGVGSVNAIESNFTGDFVASEQTEVISDAEHSEILTTENNVIPVSENSSEVLTLETENDTLAYGWEYITTSIVMENKTKYVISPDNNKIDLKISISGSTRTSYISPHDGKITLTVDSRNYQSTISKNADIKFSLPLTQGTHNCKVKYDGHTDYLNKYKFESCTHNFKINVYYQPKMDNIANVIISPGETIKIKSTAYSNINYYNSNKLKLYINGKECSFEKSNLQYLNKEKTECSFDLSYQATFEEPNLYVGHFSSQINNDEFYNGINKYFYINVVDTPTITFNITQYPTYIGDKMNIALKAIRSDSKTVERGYFKISTNLIYTTLNVKNGEATGEIYLPKTPGHYNYTISYIDPNKNQNTLYTRNYYQNTSLNFEVDLKAKTTIILPNKIFNSINNEKIKFSVGVKDNLGQNINEGYIHVNFNNKPYVFKVKNGNADISLEIQKNGVFGCSIYYSDSNNYQRSDDEFKIISKYTTNILINSVKGTAGQQIEITATVKDGNGNNIDSGHVVFNINEKTYTANVRNGKAALTIKCPPSLFYYSKYSSKNKLLTETNFYEFIYFCNGTYYGDGYVSSNKTFNTTSTKKVVKKYKITKYKTVNIKPKTGVHTKKVGKYLIVTKRFKKGSTTKIYVVFGKDKALEFYSTPYYKSGGKTRVAKTVHIKNSYSYSEITLPKGTTLKYIKIKYYEKKLIK